jgi:hypothetical protein
MLSLVVSLLPKSFPLARRPLEGTKHCSITEQRLNPQPGLQQVVSWFALRVALDSLWKNTSILRPSVLHKRALTLILMMEYIKQNTISSLLFVHKLEHLSVQTGDRGAHGPNNNLSYLPQAQSENYVEECHIHQAPYSLAQESILALSLLKKLYVEG